MTQKQSKCPPSGKLHHLLDRGKRGRWSPKSGRCWLRSSTFDGLVHHEYVPRSQTVNKEFHKTVLQSLRDAVRRHHPEKWRSGSWILHHDNAPAHGAVTTNEFLAKHNIPFLLHPPYSSDLAPCDFFLFLQLKKTMKGRPFDDKEIQANATRQMRAITKSDYQKCFRLWQESWNKCIQAQGHYFKGDKTN